MQVLVMRTIASRGFKIRGSGTFSTVIVDVLLVAGSTALN